MHPRTIRRSILAFLAAIILLAFPGTAAGATEVRIRADLLVRLPHRGTVVVSVDGYARCTGFLVRPDKVVTAAHCLLRDPSDGDFRVIRDVSDLITVVPGYSDGRSPYRACGAAHAWVNPAYARSGRDDRVYARLSADFAVVTLRCRFPESQLLGLHATGCAAAAAGAALRTSGYPFAPRHADAMDGDHLWVTGGRVQSCGIGSGLLDFSDFVAPGMSGGPAWVARRDDVPCGRPQCVVAIITRGAYGDGGEGVRITASVRSAILAH